MEAYGGGGSSYDDTALNSICLVCNNYMEICSKKGFWGSWGESSTCAQGFGGVDFQLEAFQGGGNNDDTAGNNLAIYCNPSSTEYKISAISISGWGDWQGRRYCRTGAAFCGIQTRVEARQGKGDDTALNGVRLDCCAKVASVMVRLNPLFEIAGGSGSESSVTYTKTFSLGLLSSSQFDQRTSFEIATAVSAEVSYAGAAASASASASVNTNSVSSTFSSALNTREEKRSETTTWVVKFSDPLYVYQGRTTIHMSDGSAIEMGGEFLVQANEKLSTASYPILQ